MFPDRDLCIYCLCKLYLMDNLYLIHILVYNLHKDFLYIPINIYMHQRHFVHGTEHLTHKVMVGMVNEFLQLPWEVYTKKMDYQ